MSARIAVLVDPVDVMGVQGASDVGRGDERKSGRNGCEILWNSRADSHTDCRTRDRELLRDAARCVMPKRQRCAEPAFRIQRNIDSYLYSFLLL